jgi:1-phosphofructokinase
VGHPRGKGIKVATALVRSGIKARAVVPAGGSEGTHLIALLNNYSIDVVRVPTLNRPLGTIRDVVDAAQGLRALGAGAVLARASAVSLPGSTMPGPEEVEAHRARVCPQPNWVDQVREEA